ncbi:aldehyde dehydrogenase family protein [Rhizobium herbae]|uniref:Aldehyde dehydrogenase family protein n=1 Tax=Rhizobium herbae TaxID=508661 RepID=A0ABS7HFK1_9HYPH|nr:aldehyde dehydrogenase family protein [Rhizobium herbae]
MCQCVLEAVAIVNGTLFGLAAYLYTENVKRSCRAAEAPKFGTIGFNTGAISTEVAPSPAQAIWSGREGAQAGIDQYPQMKSVHIDGRA